MRRHATKTPAAACYPLLAAAAAAVLSFSASQHLDRVHDRILGHGGAVAWRPRRRDPLHHTHMQARLAAYELWPVRGQEPAQAWLHCGIASRCRNVGTGV